MSEDGLLEEDIWDYKSIRKTKSIGQNSEIIITNVQKTNDREGKSQRSGSRSNRKTSEEKETPTKMKKGPKQRGIQKPLKPDQHFSVSNDDHVAQSQENVSASAKRKKTYKKQSTTNARPVYEGYCPSCQMPLSLLLVETPQWHVTECLDSSKTAEKECPDGLLCTSTIPSHYKKYTHFLLAASRAGDYFIESSPSSIENNIFDFDAAQSVSCSTFKAGASEDLNDSQNMGKPPKYCPPITKQCSATTSSMDVTNIKLSPLENIKEFQQYEIHSVDDTKQAEHPNSLAQKTESSEDLESQHGSHKLNMLISEVDISDCDISYSPLNTDGEGATETEEEDEVEGKAGVAKKSFQKRLVDIDSPENKSEKAGSCMFSKSVGASQLKEFNHYSVKIQSCIANNECCETLNTLQSVDNTSEFLSQDSILSNLSTSTNDLLLKHPIEDFTLPGDDKRTKEWPKLCPSAFNTGECGWGNSYDYNWPSENSVVQVTLPLEFREEGRPFLHSKSSTLNSKGRTITSICGDILAHNNSYSTIEKEGKSCSTIAMPVSPSIISKSLPYFSAANTEVQITPPKQLKQMDIGVFFGLQPKAKMESDQKKNLCERAQTFSPSATVAKRPRTRKRKADGSVGDSDVVTEGENAIPADSTSSGQRRWKKKFRESYSAEDETRKKQCPFYKKIPGTGFVVDAFQYGEIEGCVAYFLTHFHSDHYGGLTKKFTFPIYCNKITANLVKSKLRVQEQYIHVLPMDTECIVNGVRVVLLGANHCPGASMILFSLPNGTVILHTGDFRAEPSMERNLFLVGQKVHTLYLDTTYCSPEYTFPSQQEVIQFAVNTAFETVTLNPRTLVVCGTYSVGKEKVFLGIAEVLGSKVSMSQDKYKTLQCLELATINSLITLDWNDTLLHLLPMMQINFKSLQNHLNRFSKNFDQILAFKPTGWTYSDRCCSLRDIQPQTRGKITIYGIPYSEHSSFLEMKRFVQWLKPNKIIPTVNIGNWKARNEMEKHFRDWKMETAGWN
ncbi:DNA cross-link repair 1A protein [Hemicordylus capensis]|uniref:DNA cross-link repair 1A protein n=1 Tax=Hemicordylus capensis TaxID=884348 RepID=UPI002303BF30|nr:DNA cross-link repair 1A protein [Hemicordylus capensis]XP_053168036.1 DNA cross-link repair 1A protein [Hemicordylus capensis]XP_053168037.1 DNA cross-link repair 1A protein [Hemicordylus capensis]